MRMHRTSVEKAMLIGQVRRTRVAKNYTKKKPKFNR